MSGNITYKVKCRVYVAPFEPKSRGLRRAQAILSYAVNIKQIVNKENPDVILSSLVMLPLSIFFALSPKRVRKKCVYSPSTNPFELVRSRATIKVKLVTIYEAIATVFIASLGYVVFPSAYLLRKYRKLHLPVGHATTIRYFVDSNELHRLALERPINLPKDPVIISVGRLAPEKNHALLIRAFARVRAITGCTLLIVGDGPMRKDLLELSRSLNLSSDVLMLGYQDNPFKYVLRSKMFVLSSNFEGMPTSLLEAMALEVPVIATDCEGCIEILGRRNPAGVIIQRSNVAALADAMLRLLQDQGLCEHYSRMGKQRVLNFSVDSVRSHYTSLFRGIVSKSDH